MSELSEMNALINRQFEEMREMNTFLRRQQAELMEMNSRLNYMEHHVNSIYHWGTTSFMTPRRLYVSEQFTPFQQDTR
jgi:hypothetical protein